MGVEFPVSPDGRRSTSALGRSVVADALRPVDPEGAAAAEHERDWRRGYLRHFRRLIEAGLPSPDAALSVAREGLSSLYRQMRLVAADQSELGLEHVIKASPAGPAPTTVTVAGEAAPERELVIPYRDQQLSGDALLRQLDDWVGRGIIEPSCVEAIRAVATHPEWLALPGQTVVVLGAGAEVGPLSVLLSWGVNAIGVDLPSAPLWSRVLETARHSAGTLKVPVAGLPGDTGSPREVGLDLAQSAGLDLAADIPMVADWLATVDGPLVLGNYVYADGAANVRVASAVDALTVRLQAARPDVALAFLATPTDVFAVPPEAVAESCRRFAARPMAAKLARATTAGRLFKQAYVPGAAEGRRPGHQRQLHRSAGPQLRPGQTPPALARHGGPARRRQGLPQRGPADQDQIGHQEPRPGRRLRGRAPLRGGSLRPRHDPRPDGRAPGPRPLRRRQRSAGSPLAGRSPRRRPRWPVAHPLRPAQCPAGRGHARLSRLPPRITGFRRRDEERAPERNGVARITSSPRPQR